jgi:hypothetical protein
VLQLLVKDISTNIYTGLDDDEVVAEAIKNETISKAHAVEIVALAKATWFWKRQQSSGNQNIVIWNALQHMATRAQPAASLKLGHMRAADFIEQQYVEHHLLLTAAESVTYVAV